MENSEDIWRRVKKKYPKGSLVEGRVFSFEPYGLLIDIGFGCKVGESPIGIIERFGLGGLPKNQDEWPIINELVKGEVISFRERSMEIDVSLSVQKT